MPQYIVDIRIPATPDEQFYQLIPLQRSHIDKLLEEGTVMSYSLSLDRSRLWVTINARTERDVANILAKFPMSKYFEPTIYPLMFHNTSLMSGLRVSLN